MSQNIFLIVVGLFFISRFHNIVFAINMTDSQDEDEAPKNQDDVEWYDTSVGYIILCMIVILVVVPGLFLLVNCILSVKRRC